MDSVKIGDRIFEFNKDLLRFSKHNINDFIADFASHYNYYHEAHALATAAYDSAKGKYEFLLDSLFIKHKESGGTEKLAMARAETDENVVKAKEQMDLASYKVKRLYGWLRSMDKSYESAKEYCYNLRKELDKLNLSVDMLND